MSDTAPEVTRLPTLSLDALLDFDVPPFEWVVDGILPTGSFTLLTAREKAGKSLLAVDLCCSVALGESFLGRETKQGPVLFVPAEDNIRDVKARVAARLNGRRDGTLETFSWQAFGEEPLRIDKIESLARLLKTIDDIQPILVCLDPMRELHTAQENDSDDMSPLLRPLRDMAHLRNFALMMNHHMSRAGTSRGSTAIRAAVDQEWAFKRDDDESTWESLPTAGTIRVDGRFGPRQFFGISFVPPCRWELSGTIVVDESTTAQDRLVDLLRNFPNGLTTDEVATKLTITRKTVQNTTAQMMRHTAPRIVSSGRGVTGDPRRWQAIDPFLVGPELDTDCIKSSPDSPEGIGDRDNREYFPGTKSSPDSPNGGGDRDNRDYFSGTSPDSPDSPVGTTGSTGITPPFNGKAGTEKCAGCGRYLDPSRSSCPFCGSVAVRI